jgi:small subunit ribosomal protein S1
MVTRFNKETQRISLGMKQLEKDPWVNIHERYKAGDIVDGTVTNVTDYGAFVEIDEGLEGLIYVVEMVWNRKNVEPRQIVSSGQSVKVMILEIDPTKRRISLGLKQCKENPLEKFSQEYPVGSEIDGEIKDITEFGLLIQLPNDIDGTVHRSDLSWSDKSDEILDRYAIGSRVRMKILNVNPQKEIIGLGIKQLEENPWVEKFSQWKKGKSITGKVSKVVDSGIEVDLGGGIKSFISRSDLSRDKEGKKSNLFSVGDQVEAKIMSINPDTYQIALSIKVQEMEDERLAMTEYGGSEERSSLGNLLESVLESKNKEKKD